MQTYNPLEMWVLDNRSDEPQGCRMQKGSILLGGEKLM